VPRRFGTWRASPSTAPRRDRRKAIAASRAAGDEQGGRLDLRALPGAVRAPVAGRCCDTS
jgi:hypothetical protein